MSANFPPVAFPAPMQESMGTWNANRKNYDGLRKRDVQPPEGSTLASRTRRILSVIIDAVTYQAAWAALWLLGIADQLLLGSTNDLGLLAWLLGLMAWHSIWIWRAGATPGMLALRIRAIAIGPDGKRPSLKAALLRSVDGVLWLIGAMGAGIAVVATGFAAALAITSLVLLVVHPLRQTISDVLADTIVVRRMADPPPSGPARIHPNI